MNYPASGVEPGQRRLNGPQTTGRTYRNLSTVAHAIVRDEDVKVPMRDGVRLLADVHRPDSTERFPVLIAASPYPRQIQDLGAPMGFIEAGASDFFVPRGYVHLIANLRGTGGSEGTFGFFDEVERRDLFDLVEWAAEQPWSNGQVGMVGISYFAMAQLEAAVERPPHLKAIFPVAVTPDLYAGGYHHGLFCSSFISPFLAAIGITSRQGNDLWRGKLVSAARKVLNTPALHRRFGQMNGESAEGGLRLLMKAHYDPHPWDDLWHDIAVQHQVRDAFWEERTVLPALNQVHIPVYLGCDWQNVPLHLPGTFTSWKALTHNPHVRMSLMPEFGLTWPWESLHVEALAWFDHWLKNQDTGIMEGPAIRYWMPGAEEWRTAESWPPPAEHLPLALSADGSLGQQEIPGSRSYLCLGTGLSRAPSAAGQSDLPGSLTWDSAPLPASLDIVGPMELQLTATSTAIDTAWMVLLQEVSSHGHTVNITAGWMRASLRVLDSAASTLGTPVLPCRNPVAVPVGVPVDYRIPLVPNARRIQAGHRIRLILTSDDQPKDIPTIMEFRHAPVGTNTRNTIHSASRLLLPVCK